MRLAEILSRKGVSALSEEEEKFEIYDHKTNETVSGPYASRKKATQIADRKDLQYGAVRYGVRRVKTINEAVNKIPLTEEDFERVKEIFKRPIPAIVGNIVLEDIIEDDEFNQTISMLSEFEPDRDIRPLIAEWLERVMPQEMHHFTGASWTVKDKAGVMSPLHGYDPGVTQIQPAPPINGTPNKS
jgi:hypothetical protein